MSPMLNRYAIFVLHGADHRNHQPGIELVVVLADQDGRIGFAPLQVKNNICAA
jgi:hypothetical protein